ncbi:MAG TPA: hypothetical protein VGO91_11605 [Pyrinomonadaceae bacterium]|jgi:hypothetical protein|nr:hypothetical protein [Pyrinomonadaceae bacterium]
MGNNQPADLITTSEARLLLGVSAVKMAQLIKEGVVRHFSNPLDKRVKFISKREVLSLRPKRAEAA